MCTVCYQKIYRGDSQNKAKSEEHKRRWYEKNRDRLIREGPTRRDKLHFDGLRSTTVERDEEKCKVCGATEDLVVHHIDGNGRHSKSPNNSPENLITYCRSCHCLEHYPELLAAREEKQNSNWCYRLSLACCKGCSTTSSKHYSRGYCGKCYHIFIGKPRIQNRRSNGR